MIGTASMRLSSSPSILVLLLLASSGCAAPPAGISPDAGPRNQSSFSLRASEDRQSPAEAEAASRLGLLRETQHNFEEAEQLFRRALAILEENPARDQGFVAWNLWRLGRVCRFQGRYAEAEQILRRALATAGQAATEVSGNDLAEMTGELGSLYVYQSQFDKAEPLVKKALEIAETRCRFDEPAYVEAIRMQGVFYQKQGKFLEAEPYYRRCLEVLEKIHGPEHPALGPLLGSLAPIYDANGNAREAERFYRRALELKDRTGDPYAAAEGRFQLAEFYNRHDRHAEAEPLWEEAIRIREAALRPDHPELSELLNGLSVVRRSQDRLDEALGLAERAHRIARASRPPGHPYILASQLNIAETYRLMGRPHDALPMFQELMGFVEGQSHIMDPERLAKIRASYAELLRETGADPHSDTEETGDRAGNLR